MEPPDSDNSTREVFFKYSNYEKVCKRTLLAGLQCFSPKLWQRFLTPGKDCLLYIGEARNGLLEVPLLKSLFHERGSLKGCTLVCQGNTMQEKMAFEQYSDLEGLSSLDKKYQVASVEEAVYIEAQVDIALNPYEWLEITSWRDTPQEHHSLIKFRNTLRKGGIGMLVFPYSRDDRFLLQQQVTSFSYEKIPTGEAVVEELLRRSIRHQAYIVETKANLECCFQRGVFDPNKEGVLLLSYLLQVEWNTLTPLEKKQVREKVLELRAHYGCSQLLLEHLYLWIFPGKPRQRYYGKESWR